jgi:SAM-dependent methyltransferase
VNAGRVWDLGKFEEGYSKAPECSDNVEYARHAGVPIAAELYRYPLVKGWIVRQFATTPGRLFLDVGTGTGFMLYQILDAHSGRAMRFAATDVSLSQLRRLAARASQDQRRLIMPIAADAERLPFPDDTFDGATCSEALEHVFDKQRALAEIARVLRPGGVLLLTTPRRSMVGLWNLAFSAPRRLYRVAKGKGWRVPAQEGAYDEPTSPGRLREMAARAGLQIEELSTAVCLPHESYLRWIPRPLLGLWIAFARLAGPLGLGAAMGLHIRLRAHKQVE